MPGADSRGRGRPDEIAFQFNEGDDYEPPKRRTPPSRQRPPVQEHAAGETPSTSAIAETARSTPAGPDMVFVPSEPVNARTGQARLQLRRIRDGRLAVLAYTSLDLLVAGCGESQGWIAAPVEQLEKLQPLAGFDVIALDVDLPDDWRVGPAGHADAVNEDGKVNR
jgi:hypothetical protein